MYDQIQPADKLRKGPRVHDDRVPQKRPGRLVVVRNIDGRVVDHVQVAAKDHIDALHIAQRRRIRIIARHLRLIIGDICRHRAVVIGAQVA